MGKFIPETLNVSRRSLASPRIASPCEKDHIGPRRYRGANDIVLGTILDLRIAMAMRAGDKWR